MSPRNALILAAGLFAFAAGAARADTPAAASDLKCFVVLSMVSDNGDPKLNATITLGRLYFLGRLDGGAPGIDLKARFRDLAGKMTPAAAKAELARCGPILRARAAVLEDVSRSLSAPPAPAKP
jgi:hypothetical protein